ncbi:hypothetical protein KSP39_PZI004324 [Platanthera zijinensis]|uniref:Transcription factor Iwr1 domain-containing protein n=1 Tax=Platanthera zijinensis TaxID=2320716 RepID=A0AAP0BWG8_9ASPA
MTEVNMASFGTSSVTIKEKPVVVRVKRKASQASLDTFWLEINGRSLKRPFLDFEKLSLSDHESIETSRTKRLLVQHVQTVSPLEEIEVILKSLLPNSGGSGDFMRKIEMRKGHFKHGKKQQLRSLARQEQEKIVRSARFEQIWKSRKGDIDSLREICHLYDVVRVDGEDEKPLKKKEVERISPEDNAILCNYLPLLREYIPSAVEEIESEIKAYVSSEGSDGYLYDLYTVEEFIGNEQEISLDYPSVQVKDEDDFNDMPNSDYDSEDSNAEDHPRNDYPDDESLEDDEVDPFGDHECPNSDYELEMDINSKKDEETSNNEDEDMEAFSNSESSNSEHDDQDNLRWGYR